MSTPFAFLSKGKFPAHINRNQFISLSKFVLMRQGSTIEDVQLRQLFRRLLRTYKTGTLPKAILAKHVGPNCGSSRCWMGLPIGRAMHQDYTIQANRSERHDYPLHISEGATLTVHGNLVSDEITVAGTLIVHGAHEHKSLAILETGRYHVHGNSASSTTRDNKLLVTNKGTFTVKEGATYTNNASFVNNNMLDIFGTFVNKLTSTNNATVRVESSGTFTNNNQYQNNADSAISIYGTFNTNNVAYLQGTVDVHGSFVNSAIIAIQGTATVYGTLTSTALINVFDELVIEGLVENGGTIMVNSATITLSSQRSASGAVTLSGQMSSTGSLNIDSDSELAIEGLLENGGSISNSGTMTVSGSLVNLTSSTSVINSGVINVSTADHSIYNCKNYGTITNTGQVNMAVGQFDNGGTFSNAYDELTLSYGTTLVEAGFTLNNNHSNRSNPYINYVSPISNETYLSNNGQINILSGATFYIKDDFWNTSTVNIYYGGKMYLVEGGVFHNSNGVLNRVSNGIVNMNRFTYIEAGTCIDNIWSGR